MGVSDLISTPCTLVHVSQDPNTVDEYNNPVDAETNEQALCTLQQIESSEEQGVNVEETRWRVFLRAGITPPTGHDRLEDVDGYPGAIFQLLGDPNPVRPRRRLHHYEAVARSVTGADT